MTLTGPKDARHGTANGYNNHDCRCRACTDAWNVASHDRQLRWRRANGIRPREEYLDAIGSIPGGTCGRIAKYNRGCRCEDCRMAARDARRRQRAKART